ncbi:MAG: hypothetical protein ACTHM2_09700 [Afipia sp.]
MTKKTQNGSKQQPRGSYKVGYGRPPEQTKFRSETAAAAAKARWQREQPSNPMSVLDRPIAVTINGKRRKVHPHEAKMIALGKRAMKGEVRAIKAFLKDCEKAGLLEKPAAKFLCGFIEIAREVWHLGKVLVERAGPPPWDADLFAKLNAEYEKDQAIIDELERELRPTRKANEQS